MRCEVIASVFYLALMAQKNPIRFENILQLRFEQTMIKVYFPVNTEYVVFGTVVDQFFHCRWLQHPVHHYFPYSAAEVITEA